MIGTKGCQRPQKMPTSFVNSPYIALVVTPLLLKVSMGNAAAVMCDLHDVVDPRRHPGQGQHLPQHHGLQRGQRRGLVHEGVPAGEGGGHLQYSTVQYSTVQYSTVPSTFQVHVCRG